MFFKGKFFSFFAAMLMSPLIYASNGPCVKVRAFGEVLEMPETLVVDGVVYTSEPGISLRPIREEYGENGSESASGDSLGISVVHIHPGPIGEREQYEEFIENADTRKFNCASESMALHSHFDGSEVIHSLLIYDDETVMLIGGTSENEILKIVRPVFMGEQKENRCFRSLKSEIKER